MAKCMMARLELLDADLSRTAVSEAMRAPPIYRVRDMCVASALGQAIIVRGLTSRFFDLLSIDR